MLTGEIRIV
ncbi:unnamed protein product [Staurois parvus]|uniref:Uncharacterized protein n=1 Tax=Staurois parvus TaxID=386267 RepID=A0ABN9BIQ0_9NEOB|nr:unnamed protein product [Staurois parvus]